MHLIDPLFEWFLSATLRGSLLIPAVFLVQIALGRRLPAVWRHALWLPVLFVLGSPVLPPGPMNLESVWGASDPAPVAVAIEPVAEEAAPSAPGFGPAPVRIPVPWTAVAGWTWLTGSILVLLTGVIACVGALAGFRRESRPCPAGLEAEVADAARSCRLRRVPRVLVSAGVPGPAMTGWIRPLLLLPASFEETFDREERRLILRHEFTHVKRGDLPVNGLVMLLQALHWCNPIVWFAFFRFRADRELACDSAVLSMNRGDDRARYGHALLKVESAFGPAAGRLGFLGLVGLFGRGRILHSRVAAIAGHRRAHPLWHLAGPGLLIAIGITGATRAQNEPAPEGAPQIVIEARFIAVPADHPVELTSDGVTHDAENGTTVFAGGSGVIEQLASTPGADMLSAPTVVTLSGQKAVIETGTPERAAPGKSESVNTRLEVLPTLADGKIRLALEARQTREILAEGNTVFSKREIKTEVSVHPGDILIVSSLDQDEKPAPAKRLFLTVKARLLEDESAVRARLGKIIIPSLEFGDATLTDALAFLRVRSRELDPEKRGVNLVHIPVEGVPEPRLTVSFTEIPLSEALKYVAALSGLEVEFGDAAVVLRKPSGAAFRAPENPSSKSAAMAEALILPIIEFSETPLPSALKFLQFRSRELDPEKKGLNLILDAPGDPASDGIKITLTLRNVPLSEALRYVAELAHLKRRYDEDAVVLYRE